MESKNSKSSKKKEKQKGKKVNPKIPKGIASKIEEYGLTGTPAEEIICGPVSELWVHLKDKNKCWLYLNKNFFSYGRKNGWIWVPNVIGGGKKIFDIKVSKKAVLKSEKNGGIGDYGFPLIKGKKTGGINMGNCGLFNYAVRQIAHNLLGFKISDIKEASTIDTFLTIPGTDLIDAKWKGNVRTIDKGFEQLKCCKFTRHAYNKFNGTYWDVSTNTLNFNNHMHYRWCTLIKANNSNYNFYKVFIKHKSPELPGKPPYYLILIKELKKPELLKHFPWFGKGLTQGKIKSWSESSPIRENIYTWKTYLLISFYDLPKKVVSKLGIKIKVV